jgi:cytoskeleton-associated protein 5
MIDQFGIGGFPLKDIIDFSKFCTTNANPAVRTAAQKLFCEIYKHVGEQIRGFMSDIKESTLKMIDADLDKVTQYKKGEHEKKRTFRGAAAEEVEASGGGGGKKGKGGDDEIDLFADIPRVDISKKITSKFMEQFKNKDWKIRKKAGDETEAMLREAQMRIEPNGLVDLMSALKNGMKDPNKAVIKVYI